MGFPLLHVSILLIVASESQEFVFGTASASWQYEGAVSSEGRGATIWDEFCHTGHCYRNTSADTAVDQYNLTRMFDDIQRMRDINVTAYRLSIAWSRILPSGRGLIEPRGVAHYRNVLMMLRNANIEPWVTLFHFDLPLSLQLEGGWLNRSTIDAFSNYSAICFEAFGDLVKYWMTINEPHSIATAGYLYGVGAPGRCSNRSFCPYGDGMIEPYVVGEPSVKLAPHSSPLLHAFT